MGIINVLIQDEKGNRIGEEIVMPSEIIPRSDDVQFGLLRFVDLYGDTLFNRLQIPVILEELRLLKSIVQHPEHQALIQRIEGLGMLCQNEPHLYLKFIGD